MAEPVFYDPRRARWKRLRRSLDVAAILVSTLIIFFVFTALREEPLPGLFFYPQKRGFKALKESEKDRARELRKKAAARSHRKSKLAASQVTLNQSEGIRAAFYVPWDAASFSSLRDFGHQIDLLYADWLHVLTPDGHLQGVDDQTNKYFDVIQGKTVLPVDDRVMPFLKNEVPNMEVFPMVNNSDGSDWVDISGFLNDPDARALFRRQVGQFLSSGRYRGLMIDFEAFPASGQPGYVALLQELLSDLHARGMKLYVAVQPHNTEFNYPAIAAAVDGVVLMNYDEHYPGGQSGAVASQDWFVDNLKFARTVIPKEKIMCAIANYGYDWVLKPKERKLPPDVHDVSPVTAQDAWLEARDSDEDVNFDDDAMNPHFSYLDERNLQHDVWFVDAVTALNQMRAAQSLGIQTFALWRLGSEDRSLWKVWDTPGDPGAAGKLRDVPPGAEVDMEGQGEILRIEDKPAHGTRDLTIDEGSKMITDEVFQNLPEPYRVGRYGYSSNKVAITFDDGPDPEWTPKILDVLKKRHAPATFFLIGIQTDKFSGIAKRIYDEGHTVGNHTFTHPDVSNISTRYMKVELNLTERLFASMLGVRATLMRPPYAIDEEPDTADQVRPLEIPQEMGYITVGNRIDPNDWSDNPRRSAEQITSYVLSHLPPCKVENLRCGNIILLHDGGGNRAETVRALPMIIDGIRAKGYEIAPVYELFGMQKADVMAPLPRGERWAARLDRIGFWMFDAVVVGIAWIFLVGDLLMTGRLIFIGAAAIYDRVHEKIFGKPAEVASYKPKVAVLIPAYNEEKVIERTVRAALNSNYPNLRVIVIDDGSKDRTLEVARNAFRAEAAAGRVLILTKKNAGKAEALNYGIEHIGDAELFVGIDADTVIAPDAISRLVPHFINANVGAIAGNAKVGNRVNLWTRWQALEYITSQNFERRALDVLGAVSVVPGAIGAWRVSAVREAGGYHIDTVAEDADLTMALLRNGYRVEYEDMALAYTEAPTNANGLMRQRFRWSFGILQAVYKHRDVVARKGALGWVALPNIVIFQILLPLVSPLIDIMFAVGTIWYFIQKHFHPDSTDPASFHKLVAFFFAFLVIDFFASAIAFALERRRPDDKEDVLLLSQVWLQRFAYRQLFSIVLFKTLKRALEGRKFAWDKLERTAAVRYVPAEERNQVNVP
jgi:cellulose synthase/poly-beta-1,6-N-acetylglucosamine synthase-like glycosyltransferase/peptidoglycan/xylan/chitin deacetylase (PgdA/CDA1 family)